MHGKVVAEAHGAKKTDVADVAVVEDQEAAWAMSSVRPRKGVSNNSFI